MQLTYRLFGMGPRGVTAVAVLAVSTPGWMVKASAQTSAPDKTTIAAKTLDYLDSQPGASRVRVQAASMALTQPINAQWAFSGTATVDAISGASPYRQASALTRLSDQRRAADAQVTHYAAQGNVSVGLNVSTENDYFSRGWTTQFTRFNESRNFGWSIAFAHSDDVVNPVNRLVQHQRKRVDGWLIGANKVLTRHDLVQVNFSQTLWRGYLSDPYKFADQRPQTREAEVFLVRWNHHRPSSSTTWRSSYRFYRDDWGVNAHTIGLEIFQPVGPVWSVMPLVRLYRQTAAWLYVPPLGSSFPFAPFEPGPYSEDQRLGAFGAITGGVKLTRRFAQGWTADVKLERYEQRTQWASSGAAGQDLLPFRARSIQLGLSRSF